MAATTASHRPHIVSAAELFMTVQFQETRLAIPREATFIYLSWASLDLMHGLA
jgi:hypothetical protein